MAGDVIDRFLDYSEKSRFYLGRQSARGRLLLYRYANTCWLQTRLGEPAQGRYQSQVVEHCWTQIEDELVDPIQGAHGQLSHSFQHLLHLCQVAHLRSLFGGVQERRERLTGIVVKLTSDALPFFFLSRNSFLEKLATQLFFVLNFGIEACVLNRHRYLAADGGEQLLFLLVEFALTTGAHAHTSQCRPLGCQWYVDQGTQLLTLKRLGSPSPVARYVGYQDQLPQF